MSHYIHRVPGRIRVQAPKFRRNVALTEEASSFLENVPGITLVKGNVLTGSLLVFYDERVTSAEAILNRLILKRFLTPIKKARPPRSPEIPTFGTELGRRTMDALCSTVIQTVIERIVLRCLAL